MSVAFRALFGVFIALLTLSTESALPSVIFIPNPEPLSDDGFGRFITRFSQHVVVGNPSHTVNGFFNAGSVYIFAEETGALKLTVANPFPNTDDAFGIVAVVNERIAIGAPGDDSGGGIRGGCVYIYDTDGNLLRKISNPDPSIGDRFGNSLASHGDLLLVGDPHDAVMGFSAGSIYLFDTLTGELIHKVSNPDPISGDLFGYPVALTYRNPIFAKLKM